MIVDGRAIANEILEETRTRVRALSRTPVVRAITGDPSAVTLSYLRIKAAKATDAGMHLEVVTLPPNATYEDYEAALCAPGADAIIVQLPLPADIDRARLVNVVPRALDADVLSDASVRAFEQAEEGAVLPPVVAAIAEVLSRTNTEVKAKTVAIVGQGKLVGKPAAVWFTQQGAQVSVLTKDSEDRSVLSHADIVVLGVGSPALIQPSDIKDGVVLIDAGTSEQAGEMVGDADPACREKASVFTPVPGGVGPIAVACLFRNVVELLERSLRAP